MVHTEEPDPGVAAGVTEVIPVQLLLVSIGYRSLPLPGVPFDSRRAVVPNSDGRVLIAGQGLPHPVQQQQQDIGSTGCVRADWCSLSCMSCIYHMEHWHTSLSNGCWASAL